MPHFERNVFINCPFDDEYRPIFRGLVFTLLYCGLNPRCALESRNSGQIRMDKLYDLIEESKYSIHDISRVALDPITNLPRFNMPFELGLFLGAKKFGAGRHAGKNCLILEENKYDYHKYLSDIAGCDAYNHDKDPEKAMVQVRNWILPFNLNPVPSPAVLIDFFSDFNNDFPSLCAHARFDQHNLHYLDYVNLVQGWVAASSSAATPSSP